VTEDVALKNSRELIEYAQTLGVKILIYLNCNILGDIKTGARSEISYQKFVFTDLLPEDIDYLLYLDIDVVPIRSLNELFSTSFEEAFAAIALDDWISRKFARWESVANGGVQLINVKKWRESGMKEKALTFIKNFQPVESLTDEIVLNHILYKNWKKLDSGFNVSYMKTFFMFNPAERSRIRIVHFIGPRKPWITHLMTPFSYAYLKTYRRRENQVVKTTLPFQRNQSYLKGQKN
jgi:lipopolysaccharide biosynthesis glycosyltransferase